MKLLFEVNSIKFHFSPGGPLKYSLEGHKFAVFACNLTSDKRYVVSVSNKFVSWDVASSETVRDIDPSASGMMMQMDLSNDNRYAVAFTRYEASKSQI